MIVTEFYPTATTIGDDMLITDTVTAQHVTDKDIDPAKAYYMGEVDSDCSLLRSGTFKAEKSGEDISTYSYKFEQDMNAKSKWLYMTSNVSNYLYFNYLNGRWDSNFKFFNGFAPNKMNLTYTMQLTLNLRLYDFVNEHTLGNGEHVFTNNSSWDKAINLSGNVLYEFFNEGLVYNTNINGVTYHLTYDGYDVNEHCWKFDNGMRIYITGATTDVNSATSIYYSNNYVRCNVINSIELPEDGEYHDYNNNAIDRPMSTVFIDTFYFYPSDNRLDISTHKFGFHIGLYQDPSLYVYNGGKVVLRGGAPFEISYIAANYAASSSKEVLTSNGALLHATGQQTMRVNGFVDLPSIYHSGWGNHPKHVTSRDKDGNEISSYSSNTSQYEKYDDVPIFDANNVFLYRVKENKYKDLEPDLQPWQKYGADITDNKYDPDAPEPAPEGDTPGDEPQGLPHDDGQPPELQKNRRISVPALFITQYVLTASELETVGANLWTSWLTPNSDVHLNFFLPYAADFGTLNIAACMDFIISLKVFPFEFPLDILLANNNGVRMGTGHTDFLGSPTTFIKTQIYCLDVGECEVKLPEPYNDFRDIYNCTALCFMPYCGSVELNLAEILGRTLKASYFIDFQSGGCTCVIECAGDAGDYVIASKTGQIGFSLPMTATNAGQLAAQSMGDAVKFIGTASSTLFDIVGKAKDVAINIAGVNQGAQNGMDFDYAQSKADYYNAKGDIGMMQSGTNGAIGVANQVLDMLSRSGVDMPMLSGGGSAESFMFADCVSIQIRRGKYKKPDNYPHSVGYYNLSSNTIESYKGAYSGSPSTGSTTGKGFCVFTNVDTSGLDCRQDERDEILQLLSSGIYL